MNTLKAEKDSLGSLFSEEPLEHLPIEVEAVEAPEYEEGLEEVRLDGREIRQYFYTGPHPKNFKEDLWASVLKKLAERED